MGLFRDRSISDVVDKLDLTLTDKLGESVAPSAIPQARQRLTSEPLAALFNLTAAHWIAEEDSKDTWHGLRLYSVDGTPFRTADIPELAKHFGYVKHSRSAHTEYHVVRLCAFSSLRSRMVHHVAFGPSHQGEVTYTKLLLAHVPDHSLTIFDRCYLSAELLINWQCPHAHWMVPVKSNTQYTVLHSFSGCDHLVEMKVSPQARKLDP